jgi:D-alanyl-D-alanine dipeptidase
VAVRSVVPDAVLDVRYATKDNFVGRPLYPFPAAYLRRSTAEKVKAAAGLLREKGLRLVVYDAYRPLSVQREMWKVKPDRRFVADPATGSRHNRGAAIDAALADRRGRRLRMPSDFDAFAPEAALGAKGVPEKAAANARTLRNAMVAAGLKPLSTEWWHFSDPDAADWPLLDVPLEALR